MERKNLERCVGIALSLLASACYALLPLFTLPLLKEGISVATIMSYRFIIGTVVLWCILILKRERILVGASDMVKLFILSLLSYLMVICYAEALKYMASGPVTTLQFLYPIMVMLIMIFFYHEKFHWYTGVAVGLAFFGVALLSFGGGDSGENHGSMALGVILSLAAGLWSALYYVGIKVARIPHVDSLLMTFYIALFGAIFCTIQGVFGGSLQFIEGFSNLGLASLLAIVTIVITNLALIKGIELVGPTMSSILGVTEPLTAVAIGATVFGEPLTMPIIVGIGLVILSVVIIIVGPDFAHKADIYDEPRIASGRIPRC